MLDAPPSHVGDVQQAVDAAQVHEGAIVGEVLDHALHLQALLQALQQRLPFGAVLLIEHAPAGDHHIVALLVDLDDLEVHLLAFQLVGGMEGADVHQGAGQEGADVADVHGEAALHPAADDAADRRLGLMDLLQHGPGFGALGLLPGQLGLPEAVVHGIHGDLHGVADGHLQLAAIVQELGAGDDPFGFEPRMDGDPLIVDVHHHAGDDRAHLHLQGLLALFEQFGKTFAHCMCFLCPPWPERACWFRQG